MRDKNKNQYVVFFLLVCIGLGIILHIVPFFYNRALWVDEANLASSLFTRDFGNMISSPLDFGQSAPIGWLYIVKTIVEVFGKSRTSLRIWSLISSFLCMVVFYLLMKKKCNTNYILFFIAIFLLTDKYIYYGNEAKSYMSDNFFCLISLYIWQNYQEKKIGLNILVILYSIIIWFSFPSVFFAAAIMLVVCYQTIVTMIRGKEKVEGIACLLKCAFVLLSFILYFYFWLSKTSTNAGAPEYWDLLRFPLIPKSKSDLCLAKKMLIEFLAFYPETIRIVWSILTFSYLITAFAKKKDASLVLIPCLVSFFILLVASKLGYYPIQDRLVQIYGIIVLMFSCFMCDDIEKFFRISPNRIMLYCRYLFYIALYILLLKTGVNGCQNISQNHIYVYGSEVDKHQQFLSEYLKDDELVYVQFEAYPSFIFENDYNLSNLVLNNNLNFEFDLDIFSNKILNMRGYYVRGHKLIKYSYKIPYSYEGTVDMELVVKDAEYIRKFKSAYIYCSHNTSGIPQLIEELEKYGEITRVVDNYGTYLYHYVVNS